MCFKVSKKLSEKLLDFWSRTSNYKCLNSIPDEFYDDIHDLAVGISLDTKCENPNLYMSAYELQQKLCIGGIWRYDHICRVEIIRYLSTEVS